MEEVSPCTTLVEGLFDILVHSIVPLWLHLLLFFILGDLHGFVSCMGFVLVLVQGFMSVVVDRGCKLISSEEVQSSFMSVDGLDVSVEHEEADPGPPGVGPRVPGVLLDLVDRG